MMVWFKRVGAIAVVLVVILLLWRVLFIAVALIGLVAAMVITRQLWREWYSVRKFRKAGQPRGKDLVLVYSNSPNWQHYVEQTWLPKWERRAVVLNWSIRPAASQAWHT